MILAPAQDRTLRAIIRRAALPEEDVFHRHEDILEALRMGYPRVLVSGQDELPQVRSFLGSGPSRVPVLTLDPSVLGDWAWSWAAQGAVVSRIDDAALRLRRLVAGLVRHPDWVEEVFSDLTQISGQGLPPEFRGFARRVLEFPARYMSLERTGGAFGLTPGALKGRFRRRGLPSPATYLRWFRLLRAAQILSDPSETTLSAADRLGFASDGNFCRWATAISGMNPSALREWNVRLLLLVRFSDECLPEGALEQWESLQGLFVSQVA